MLFKPRAYLFALALGCLVPSVASAQSGQDWLRIRFGNALRPDASWELVWSTMLGLYRASNPSERGVTEESGRQLRQIAAAQGRARAYGAILAQDLDGDGQITRAELVAFYQPQARRSMRVNGQQLEPTEAQIRAQLDGLVATALLIDTDRDGLISSAEIKRRAEASGEEQAMRGGVEAQVVPLSLDANGDGAVSRDEFEAAVRREFTSADGDKNGQISPDEMAAYQRLAAEARRAEQEAARERSRRLQLEASVKSCAVDRPPAGARVVLIGGYEGRALSNVSIGGDDREVSVANVEVAPGTEPLFIVVASQDAMVWRVTGATERVAGFLAHATAGDRDSRRPRVGVVGLPPERVRFTAAAGCMPYFTDRDYGGGVLAVEMLFGKRPDETVGLYGLQTIRVPDARHDGKTPAGLVNVSLPTEGPAAAVWRDMERFYPAGLASIDPATVVSPLPIKRYEILPQQAGLAQLVEEGALKIAGTSRGVRIQQGGAAPTESPSSFLIIRKMRFPAGLHGSHAVRFILARDIPMPDGDPGHSCLIAENDGKPIGHRPNCR